MKNVSIRSKILAGVALVILVGALLVVVYLHQSYSSGLDVHAQESVGRSVTAWNVLYDADEVQLGMNAETIEVVATLSEATGGDYALMMLMDSLDQEVYEEARQDLGLAGNWGGREPYVLVTETEAGLMDEVRFGSDPHDVAGIGKVVGIENGACSEMCHAGIAGKDGDFWEVAWSEDTRSRTHAVFPIDVGEGDLVGVMYYVGDISPEADAARESMVRTLFVIGLTLAAAAGLISWMLDFLVFRRLGRMIVTIEEVSLVVAGGGGDVDFEPGHRNDEIGQFEEFFSQFLKLVSSVFESLHGRK